MNTWHVFKREVIFGFKRLHYPKIVKWCNNCGIILYFKINMTPFALWFCTPVFNFTLVFYITSYEHQCSPYPTFKTPWTPLNTIVLRCSNFFRRVRIHTKVFTFWTLAFKFWTLVSNLNVKCPKRCPTFRLTFWKLGNFWRFRPHLSLKRS